MIKYTSSFFLSITNTPFLMKGIPRTDISSREMTTSKELGDTVLVYQGPLLYDSKILRIYDAKTRKVKSWNEKQKEIVEVKSDRSLPAKLKSQSAYYVHYQGWNKKWDEWVSDDRMIEKNAENVTLQKSLKLQLKVRQELSKTPKAPKVSSSVIDRSHSRSRSRSGSHAPSKGVKKEHGVVEKHSSLNHNGESRNQQHKASKSRSPRTYANTFYEQLSKHSSEFTVAVPSQIKLILVKDWENITKNEKQVVLDKPCSVSAVLRQFTKYICQDLTGSSDLSSDKEEEKIKLLDDAAVDNFLEISESLKLYFNRSLGSLLLYRYEREQYKEVLKEHEMDEMADVYPPVFLLRLCVIFPNLMIESKMDVNSLKVVQQFLEQFYGWLISHKDEYLKVEYENCMPLIPFMQ